MARLAVILSMAALALPAGALAGVNPQVAGLQVALRAHGLYLAQIDGISGPLTVNAVHAFQREHGLSVGAANARTRIALGPLGAPLFGSRVLRAGDFGFDVAVLQFLLTRDGVYTGALDGYLGKATAAALRRFQHRSHLTADAVLGPRTLFSIVHRDQVPVRASAATRAPTNNVPVLLDDWSGRLGVDSKLVRALAWMESGYQTRIISSAGARGVMQTLPSTRDYVETVLAGHAIPKTVSGDVEVGVLYLKHLLNAFSGDDSLALAAWYQGEQAVRDHGVYTVSKPFVANVLALRARM
jgi:peptidoglycan hydrolase-like protein with peptidoglycan-binding domain